MAWFREKKKNPAGGRGITNFTNELWAAGSKSHKQHDDTYDPRKYYAVVRETALIKCLCARVPVRVRAKERAFVHLGIASMTHTFARGAHASSPPSLTSPVSVIASIHPSICPLHSSPLVSSLLLSAPLLSASPLPIDFCSFQLSLLINSNGPVLCKKTRVKISSSNVELCHRPISEKSPSPLFTWRHLTFFDVTKGIVSEMPPHMCFVFVPL